MFELCKAIYLEVVYQRRNATLQAQGKRPYSRKAWRKRNPDLEVLWPT